MNLANHLVLYYEKKLNDIVENVSAIKVAKGKVERVQLEEEEGHSCPRCTAPVTVAQLRELFPKAEEDTLKTVADTYTKYMKELQMDTCWNKAHFFAQAAIETGSKLHIKKGENMDYTSEERLHNVFLSRFFKGKRVKGKFVPLVDPKAEFHDEKNRVFKSKELSQKASELIKSTPRDQNIANFVYANINGNKDEASGDGWRFRGSGLIQLTGRENFKMVNDKIEKLWGQSILTDSGADQVRENRELAVLTAMGYFAAKGINRIANGANSDQQIKEVCLKVGNDVDIKIKNGKTTNHEEKKRFFKDKSSKTFKTNECLWGHSKGKAPWMPFAIQELQTYGGIRQTESPLKERIFEYFEKSSNINGTNRTAWCASFVNWCFYQAGYTKINPNTNDAAFDWLPPSESKKKRTGVDGWVEGELITDIKDVFVGAVIVFSHSHVAFVLGETKDGKSFVYLGGNQSNRKKGDGSGRRTICTNPISKSEFNSKFWIVKPKDYAPSEKEKILPKISPDGKELDYSTTH